MSEYELKKKGDVEKTLEDASDKVQAAAKAVANKVKDPEQGPRYRIHKREDKRKARLG